MNDINPIIIRDPNWRIPAVTGQSANGPCMETSEFTTDRIYISCGAPATMRLWDPRAKRCYDFCTTCGEHNLRRGMVLNKI